MERDHYRCIMQYRKIKEALYLTEGFGDKTDLIVCIAKLNFDVSEISEELMSHLVGLVDTMEREPWKFDSTDIDIDE